MLRGALLGLGDTAGNTIASRSHLERLESRSAENDVSLLNLGRRFS